MSLKKLSLAAAVSIGVLSINGLANAGPCPVCPQQTMIPQEPCCPQVQTVCPTCKVNPCACPCEPAQLVQCEPVEACLPNCHPNAEILKRQAFAFPSIGSSSVVMPKGKGLLQIGGEEEAVAAGNYSTSGLTAFPERGQVLTLYPKGAPVGAACGIVPVCPVEIMQGVDIGRCAIPNSTGILQSAAYCGCDPCSTGGAVAIPVCVDPCNPCPQPCQPCNPCNPCQTCVPCNPCDPCSTGAAIPCNPCFDPCNPCNPCDPCATGAAAQLKGC